MQDFVDVVCAKFEEVALSGNVVYFEFWLHRLNLLNIRLLTTVSNDLAGK